MFMFADPDTYTTKKGNDRQDTGVRGNGWIGGRANTYELWVSRKFAASRCDWDRTFQSRSLRSCGTENSSKARMSGGRNWEVIEATWGKSQGKYMSEEDRGNLPNYREIIKSILLFTTPYHRPVTVFGTIPDWMTRCDSLTIYWAISMIFQILRSCTSISKYLRRCKFVKSKLNVI